ncbi:lamin tail domain-containing protein [Ammoniphilus sp. CFH 90114]|uniref:lamin tail domain-containing protein n=1 Tax=Ammoniphilus sp. CFH 90114 TaxID=2493665 RepID=UPI00100F26C7|nr:lamin tail domain-containing protein [Ammoniphilus sp. CFH 90114]RXT02835.1 hypothetical protein EIZ39_24165 [Ammoniphilus sp. CFH 90114]
MIKGRKLAKAFLASAIWLTNVIGGTPGSAEESSSGPELLVTEVVPNNSGSDYYEFFEIYNNTNTSLNAKDYKVVYGYYDNRTPVEWDLTEEKIIPPHGSLVIWVKQNQDVTPSQFNSHYGVELLDEQVTSVLGGMANSGGRTIAIAHDTGEILSSATYNEQNSSSTVDTVSGKSITYRFPDAGSHEMIKIASGQDPTPGLILNGQVPSSGNPNPNDDLPPVITHQPIANAVTGDLRVQADVYDEVGLTAVNLYYRTSTEAHFKTTPMGLIEGKKYEAVIPAMDLSTGNELLYYLEARDGINRATLPADQAYFTVPIEQQKASPTELFITELVPDNSGADAFEYIELYNPTNKPLNMRNYHIRYTYPAGTYQIWNFDKDQIVPPQGTIIVWVRTISSEGKTIHDFNAHFNSDVKEEQLIEIEAGGMVNSGMRNMVLMTDTGAEITNAKYNDIVKDTMAGKSIVYKYPIGESREMVKLANGQVPTPGAVRDDQIPMSLITLPEDNQAPEIQHTVPFSSTKPVNLDLSADVRDNRQTHRVTLYYKTNAQSEYQHIDLVADQDYLYAANITKYDIMSGNQVMYYFEATDGMNTVTMPQDREHPYVIEMNHDPIPTLSVNNGEYVKGNYMLQGYSALPEERLTLKIDGETVPAKSVLPKNAYLVFEADGLQPALGFKNGILKGDEVLHVFEGIHDYLQFETVAVEIPVNTLEPGTNTLSIWSGDRVSPTSNEGNNDDFSVRNVRLVLGDGTIIRDASYKPGQSYGINDNIQYRDYSFVIPQEKFLAVRYDWDTTSVLDKEHQIELIAEGPQEVKNHSVRVLVDNTAPTIQSMTPEEGQAYKGTISFSASVSDSGSGIEKIVGYLDGKRIEVPTSMSAADLVQGAHEFEVHVEDKAGNITKMKHLFEVIEEKPYPARDPQPAHKATGIDLNPTLKVTAEDPTGDPMEVSFFRAYQYDFKERGDSRAFSNAVDREPPLEMLPQGESNFDEAAYGAISVSDDVYYTTDSKEEFPYQRFEMKIEDDLTGIEKVELKWEGHSLPGRLVTLYVWNHHTLKWEQVDSGKGETDFILRGEVSVAEMVRNQTIQVLVQDQIPSPDEYDFSFGWITDTQYYSKNYPHIFDKMTQWIADNQMEKKLKYVVHTGDLVDNMEEIQYVRADASMKILDNANIPYGVLAGNHDVHYNAADYSMYSKYFGRDRFAHLPHYGGDLDNNRDHFDLISSNGHDFIILYLGWVIDQESIDWANEVLKRYEDRNAIVAVHENINPEGKYSGQGQEIWDKIVVPNDNVFMVLSGHIIGVSHNIKMIGDRQVIEMLANYQGLAEGGLGYLRMLYFDAENQQMIVNTYSPYLNDYNYYEDEKEELTLPIALKPIEKRVATDYITVNVRTNEKIGSKTDVPSGSEAEVTWSGLKENTTYSWYAKMEDAFGGKEISDVWTFTTKGEGQSPNAALYLQAPSQVHEGSAFSVGVYVYEMKDLYGASIEIDYDSTKLEPIDADPNMEGIQLQLSDWLYGTTVKNSVYQDVYEGVGKIRFAVTQLGEKPGVSGEGLLAKAQFKVKDGASGQLIFRPVASSIQMVNSNNQPISVDAQPIHVPIASSMKLFGKVKLPNTHHLHDLSGFNVKVLLNQQVISETQTDQNGSYEVSVVSPGTYQVVVERKGYLNATQSTTMYDAATSVEVPDMELYVGDYDGNERINIIDVSLISKQFEKLKVESNALFDVDDSGTIGLYDVVTVARNFGKLSNF